MLPPVLLALGAVLLSIPKALGFTWRYPVSPRQCSPFSVIVNGTDVVFPLKYLLVPVGPSPLLAVEVRSVMEIPFPTNSLSLNFTLPYPADSKFVGLVADASGYEGTANTRTVLSSTNASCFDATTAVTSPFTFSLSPTDVAECQNVRIYWTASSVQGTPSFLSVIPDGAFATIPLGRIEAQTGLGTGFTWQPTIRANTNLIIVGGDNRAMGAGGFINSLVRPGNPNRNATGACPAPTPTPTTSTVGNATAPYSTSPSTSASTVSQSPTFFPPRPGSPSSKTVGAIVGGVLGGIAVFGILFVIMQRLIRKKPEAGIAPIMQQQQHEPVARAGFNPAYYGIPGAQAGYGSSIPPTQPSSGSYAIPSTIPSPQSTGTGGWGVVSQDLLVSQQQWSSPMPVLHTGHSGSTGVASTGHSGFFPPESGPVSTPSSTWRG